MTEYSEGDTFTVEPETIELHFPTPDGTKLREVHVDHVEIVNVQDDGDLEVAHRSPSGENFRTLTLTPDDLDEARGDWLADSAA